MCTVQRFRAVLNWLRTRELVLEGGVSAEGIKAEAEFFQLQALADEASCMIHEREGHRLLQAAVDSRRGKLVSLGAGETASLPTGEPVLVHGPCVVAVHACFEAVGAGISGEMHVDGLGAVPEFVIHSSDSGRTLRAVGRVGPGRHHLQLLFRHCGMDEQPRCYVFGPARVEFWRYPSAHMVWMDEEAALKNTAAWYAHVHGPPSSPYPRSIPPGAGGCGSGADFTTGPAADTSFESASAEELASMVGAISSCVYR
jgi:hypothetical protein